ncbi:VC0807 family protein [Brevibacterium oceani]|uniref:VC0807 family protein n=1 Tax=Brevibacterium oceani TaxID=358099 RepID=UPI002484865A|nr:VC0807 family protein [Brevibacterium oceani]
MTARVGRDRPAVVVVLTHLVAPLAVFYGLRALGAGPWIALMAGTTITAIETIFTAVHRRRLDTVSITVLAILVISAGSSLVTGDARLLLVRNAAGTALIGAWLLVTLCLRRPLLFDGARMFQSAEARQRWDRRWQGSSVFRRALRVLTAAWGAGFLVDAVIRLLLALTLPVDLVPLLDNVLLVVTVMVLLVTQKIVGAHYRNRYGLHLRQGSSDQRED